MSPNENAHAHGVAAEEDHVPTGRLLWVGLGSLAVFFVASVATVALMGRVTKAALPAGPAPRPAEVGVAKIGMVEQPLFQSARGAAQMLDEQRRRLGSYGWVDREKGVVHIPIEQAMDLAAGGARP